MLSTNASKPQTKLGILHLFRSISDGFGTAADLQRNVHFFLNQKSGTLSESTHHNNTIDDFLFETEPIPVISPHVLDPSMRSLSFRFEFEQGAGPTVWEAELTSSEHDIKVENVPNMTSLHILSKSSPRTLGSRTKPLGVIDTTDTS